MNDAELYLQHLELVTGRSEDVIHKLNSSDGTLPNVFVFIYHNWPRTGFITGFTWGLSAAEHPDWKLGKPELMVSVESDDEAWPLAIAYMAERLRGNCPFSYGSTINFRANVSQTSALDGFLVFAPPFLGKGQNAVGLSDFTCHMVGMYPVFSSEFSLLEELGVKRFWDLPEWDPFDISRQPLQ